MDKAVKHVQNGLGRLWNAEQKLMVLQEWQVPGWTNITTGRRHTAPWACSCQTSVSATWLVKNTTRPVHN